MNLLDRITVDPGKCGGRPCIRGYRLRVSDVLGLIASGATNEEILEDYPSLNQMTSWRRCDMPRTRQIIR